MEKVTVPITITIPVGPHPQNTRWLGECLLSIVEQTVMPDEVLLIDNGAHLDPSTLPHLPIRIYTMPWTASIAHAFNCGVALARNDLVIMLGSDDKLFPDCVRTCWASWQRMQDPHGYYAMTVEYDDGRLQNDPCNAAMVHKALWNLTGGFPIEAAIGACDTWLISKIMIGGGGNLYHMSEYPTYWYRNHAETDTRTRAAWFGIIEQARDLWLRRGTT